MKRLIAFFVLVTALAVTSLTTAQTPYDNFEPEQAGKAMLSLPSMAFQVNNQNENGPIGKLELDIKSMTLNLKDANNIILSSKKLNPKDLKWTTMDPLAESYYSTSPYAYCLNNPIKYIDPDGCSTHTDSSGTVVAVYNDDDKSVYRHDELPDSYAKTEGETETYVDPATGKTKTREKGRLSGGEDMGNTADWDEFRRHDNNGRILNGVEGQIMFGENWSSVLNINNIVANLIGLPITAIASLPGKPFDIKSFQVYAPYGPATGKMMNGTYMSARSAGNYLAGLNGATGTIMGLHISMEMYMRLAGQVHSPGNNNGGPYYGEIPYAGRMIIRGFNAGLKR